MSIQKLIRRSGVKLRIAKEDDTTPGTPGAFVSVGRVKNQIQLNDSRGTQTITDFETAADAISQQITDGRTVGMTFTTNLVTDDAGYTLAETQYKADELVWLEVEATAIDGSTVKEWGFIGFLNQFNHTFNETIIPIDNCIFLQLDCNLLMSKWIFCNYKYTCCIHI